MERINISDVCAELIINTSCPLPAKGLWFECVEIFDNVNVSHSHMYGSGKF